MSKNSKSAAVKETPDQELVRLRAENAKLRGEKPVKPLTVDRYTTKKGVLTDSFVVKGGALGWRGVFVSKDAFDFLCSHAAEIKAEMVKQLGNSKPEEKASAPTPTTSNGAKCAA